MVSNSRALACRSLSAGKSQIEPLAALIPTILSGTCRPEPQGTLHVTAEEEYPFVCSLTYFPIFPSAPHSPLLPDLQMGSTPASQTLS